MQFAGKNFSFRRATQDDIQQVMVVERQSYPLPWTLSGFEAELGKPYSTFLVLTDDETDHEITGYIVYWILDTEMHILNVAVHLEWRGLGVGSQMIRHAVNDA